MARDTASPELAQLLAAVRRRLFRLAWLESTLAAAVGCLAALAVGAAAFGLGWQQGTTALLELVVLLSALGFGLVRYGILPARSLLAPAALASWLDRALAARERSLPVSFRSGFELSRDRGRFEESPELAELALKGLLQAAATLDVGELVSGHARPRLGRKLVLLGSFVLLVAAIGLFAPSHLSSALWAVPLLAKSETSLLPLPGEPRFSDLRLNLRFPAYAQRPPVTIVSPTGEIRALPGTEVTIETQSRQRLAEATLIINHGESDETRSQVEVDGRRLQATLVVSRSGRYRFSVRTEDGEVLEERRGRKLELELDAPPEVTLLRPVTSPLEVNEQDRVELEVTASDDFGLGYLRVAWRVLGTTREGQRPLAAATRGRKRAHEQVMFELGPLGLKSGDRVAYSVEALDNDTVNGPKAGASETRELRVYSKEAHHREVLALAEEALDELIHILGDGLEAAVGEAVQATASEKPLAALTAVVERAKNANPKLKEVVGALKKDPLGQRGVAQAFEVARADLQEAARNQRLAVEDARAQLTRDKAVDERRSRRVEKKKVELVSGLEKNVVYLADLLNDQRMIDAEALTRQLREEQAALRQALEAYRSSPTPEQRRLLEQAIKDIKARISEITAELSRLRATIPPDFVNPDAFLADDAQAAMDRVQKMIEEGDLDGAMAELEKMLTGTEQMLSEMQEGRQELGSREYSEITEEARRLWQNLEQVESEQAALSRRTEQHSQAMQKRMKERLGDAADFIAKQTKRLEQARRALERAEIGAHLGEGDPWEMALRRVDDTQRALEGRDFGAAREAVFQAVGQLRQLEDDLDRRLEQGRRFGDLFAPSAETEGAFRDASKAKQQTEDVLADLERLMPEPSQLLSKEELAELSKLGDRQRAAKERAQSLGEQLDRLAQQLPIVGEGTKELAEEAARAMGESERSLGKGDAPSALSQEQRALESLGRLKDVLEKMAEQQQGGGGTGGGVPLPFGPEGGTGEEDSTYPGSDPRSPERVEIPKPEQYKAPAEFREDILKAAKHGTVEEYREAVRRYYEEIIK